MQLFASKTQFLPRPWIPVLAASLLALSAPLQAGTIEAGDVTTLLGPTFFIDEATNGGVDTDLNQPNSAFLLRSFNGLLTPNQGPTRVVLTGFGLALHTSATANDATSVAVAFTYLGADEAVGGSDDVVIGTATGTLNFTAGGEYAFAFATPLTANLNVTGTRFRITITPTNLAGTGSLKIKSLSPSFAPYVSVAGVASSTLNPQRVNLAKYQTVTASSVAGARLASYATDGDAGNDSLWQSQSWAFNNARIDFPFPVEVGSAQVFMGVNDTLPLAKFSIQYLVGSTWTTIPVTNISENTNVERNFNFLSTITASSFRIIVTDPVIRLREFALYPPNGGSGYPLGTDINLNLAYQRPAVASSFTTGAFPLNAVDGRTHVGSAWQTTTVGVNTLDIEMVAATKVGSVHLYSGSSTAAPLADFTLKYWSGSAWVDIAGGGVTGNASADRVITFTMPVSTTQVRLEFTKTTTTPTVIRELQIFPANTGNVGYPLGTNINSSGAYASHETFNDAFYQIVSPAANRDIAVATGGQPALDQAGVTTAQTQYQVLLNLSNGTYRLRNRDTGNCLSGAQLSKTDGAALTDAPYIAMPHQDWILEPLGGGLYQIVNAWSGLVVDTLGGATAAGTSLVQNTASSATTQRWQFSKDTWAPKKGVGGSNFAAPLKADWMYNWGPTNSVTLPADTIYHPMQWGSFNWVYGTGPGPIWQHTSAWRKRGDGMILLGFNEPDRTDQSNITLADCLALWPRLMALDQPLLSPSPGTLNPPAGPSWHQQFYDEADRLGYRVEYNAIHTYPSPNGGSSDGLVNLVQGEFNDFGLPVWLTEFSFVDWGGNQSWSEEDSYQTLAEFLWRAENLTALRKYALFVFSENAENPQPPNSFTNYTPAPRSNSYDISGNLTAFGRLYAGWDNDTTVRADKTYLIHNRALRKRMANAATTNTAPGGRTIRTDGPIVNWTLVSAGVANRYYVVSSIDGRRLSHTTGTGVSPTLAAAGTTGVNVEWSLTATTHGWHYLGHPASSTRLRLASFNTSNNVASYQMVATTTTDNNTQWRFIVPLEANSAPVFASIPDQVVNELTAVTFTASATDTTLPTGPITYSLIDPLFNSSINATTGVYTWTPTETQGNGTTYAVRIRASDGQLATEQVVNITANEVNSPPSLSSIANQTVSEGALLTFTASASDADLPATPLSYSLVSAPAGASIDGSTGVFNWTPTEAQGPGSFNFTVRAGDGNLTHDRPVSVTVNESNVAPVLTTIPSQTVNQGSLLTFTASATDADLPANTLSYSLIGAPGGASIHSATGVFSWTPAGAQGPGGFNFTVRVSDGILADDQLVSVNVLPPNEAPVLATIPPQTVNEGTLLTFTASATDTDLPTNTLTYSLIGAPVGASIAASTGVFTWTPTEAQGPATFNFTVRVSDGNLTHDQPVAVTVTDDGGDDHLATWIVAGQSNAEGYGITENPINGLAPADTLATIGRSDLNVTHNNIQMFQGANDSNGITTSAGSSLPPRDTWHAMTAQEGLAFDWGSGRGNESRRRFGPELAFGFEVQQQLGSPIALIKYARGSCSIAPSIAQSGGVWRDFDPSDGGRLNQYDKLVSTIQAAVTSLPAGQVLKMRGVVWMQGESDATAAAAPSYQANLTELIAALRTDIGAIAAASGGRLTRSAASWNELDVFIGTVQNANANRQTVIDAQNAVDAADANVLTVNGTTGLSMMTFDDWGDSGVHYDTAGQVLLGERFADAAISRIDSGVLVAESGGATSVTEGGNTDTYTVTLTRAPSADVTISISPDSQVSVSPTSLSFTSVNWATPQIVTITAVNDTLDESNHSGLISHGLSSSDSSFGGWPIDGVTAAVIDNDANSAPVLAAIPPQTVNQGTLLTFTASATDDGLPVNTLTYSLVAAPVGASIAPGTGVFTWTPAGAQGPATFNFTVRVSDGNLTHDQPVSVTVENPPPGPEVDTDGDGLSDLLEHAFMTSPGTPNGNPFRVIGSTAGTVTLEFPWNWQANGLSWQIRHGIDHSNIASWPVVAPGTTTITREGDIDRVTVSPAMAHPGRGFYVLEVTGN